MISVHESIKHSLSSIEYGRVIFPTDFRGKGSQNAIKMALSRLTQSGEVKRIAHGIYYRPIIDPKLGELIPPPELIAEQLAEKEKVRIRPAGTYALNKLGLSTQVPTRLVYLTDGHPRKLKIGKITVEFKSTTPKKMALSESISGHLILALEELNLQNMELDKENKILKLLQKENRHILENDLRLASARIYNYLSTLIKKLDDRTI